MDFITLAPLLEQSPGLIGAIIIVLAFIKYIQKRDGFMRELQRESNQVMRETKEQLGQNAAVLSEVLHTVKHLNGGARLVVIENDKERG